MSEPAPVAVASGDDAARDLLVRIVERAGFPARTISVSASSIGELLAAAPAIVVLDLDAGAPDVVRTIRSHPDPLVASRRIVILADGPAVGRRAWAEGTDGFLARPFHHDDLLATLRDVLDRPEADRDAVRRAGTSLNQG